MELYGNEMAPQVLYIYSGVLLLDRTFCVLTKPVRDSPANVWQRRGRRINVQRKNFGLSVLYSPAGGGGASYLMRATPIGLE